MQKKNLNLKQTSGFTLIEILVVIGLIALLAAIVIIAINPARQFAQGRNTQRTSNVNTILNAIGQYAADHRGNIPPAIPATPDTIDAADLCADIMPTYVPSLPTDPNSGASGAPITDCATASTTDYIVGQDGNARITVCTEHVNEETAFNPALPEICVTR